MVRVVDVVPPLPLDAGQVDHDLGDLDGDLGDLGDLVVPDD